ncbi:unnamed protein product [Urochloa humidicola]
MRTSLAESSPAAGSPPLMSRDLLRRLPHKEIGTMFELPHPTYFRLHLRPVSASASSFSNKNVAVGNTSAVTEQLRKVHKGSSTEGLIYSGILKDIESRILTLETVCNFYKKFQWLLIGPIVAGLLMAVPPAIDIFRGISEVKKRQKNTVEKLSNLNKRIEYLEGRSN